MDESGAKSMEALHFFYDAQSRPAFVGDVYFEYSENSAVCGYSQTEPYGGVIRNGQYLKIGYVYHPSYGNIIVYIEENTLLSRFSAPAK